MENNIGFDFGFSLVDEDELDAVQNASTVVEATVQELGSVQDRLDAVYNMITPLLNNLGASPEKDYLLWPGAQRIAKIEEFSDKLRNAYNGGNA
jgi:hypothetical protein